MVRFPWVDRDGYEDDGDEPDDAEVVDTAAEASSGDGNHQAHGETDGGDGRSDHHSEEEPLVSCDFQDGTLHVYEELIFIERAKGSKFVDKWIAMNQVRGVTFERRLIIQYLQIEQVDFENNSAGFLSTPVDENTLHFGRGMRGCAQEATETILERMDAV